MSYTDAQLRATKAYILEFFGSEITRTKSDITQNNMTDFEKHLNRILFRDLPQFKPDKFELKKSGASEPYFIEWINNNILPFPENFSVTLTNNGDSYAEHQGVTTMIFDPKITLSNSIDMSSSAESMSICTPSPSSSEKEAKDSTKTATAERLPTCPLSKPTSPLKTTTQKPKQEPKQEPKLEIVNKNFHGIENEQEPSEKEKIEQEKIFYNACYEGLYEYIKCTPKKRGKRNVIIYDTSKIDMNNVYRDQEPPKYDDKTRGMYIPIYKKNKYGDVYRTMRATVAETTPIPVTTPKTTQNTEDTFQFEYENLISNVKNFRIS